MVHTAAQEPVAHLVEPEQAETIGILGPTVQLLTQPLDEDLAPCVMRGTIPPGGVVPLQSHADPETFYLISGEVEGLSEAGDRFTWSPIRPGEVFHVPGGAKHAWRNPGFGQGGEPAVMLLITMSKLARFFREIGTPISPGAQPPGPPSKETMRHFHETARTYGYWNATPEENARVGIVLPAA